MRSFVVALSLLTLVNAQFGGIFEQMFGGNGGGGGHEHHGQRQNNPSDAQIYRHNYDQCTLPAVLRN